VATRKCGGDGGARRVRNHDEGFSARSARSAQSLRRAVRRTLGTLVRARVGYVFVSRRALAASVDRLRRPRPAARRVRAAVFADMAAIAPGASYRELEPPAPGAPTPVGWDWPRRFRSRDAPDPPRPPRGQGVVEIPGGVVFGRRGYYGPDAGHVLVDACALWTGDEARSLAEADRARALGLVDLEGVTMSLWANGANYAHCLLQSVPRLALLERAFGWDADRFLLVDDAPAPMAEAIARVGVPADRIMRVPRVDAPAYRCTTLRAATSPLTDEFGIAWAAEFLRSVFLSDERPSTPAHLYIRRGVARRRVLNEQNVFAVLEPAGFTAVTLGGRPVCEQAALFANAEVVVASHGAALANLVFCRPGTTVIELLGPNTATAAFARLAWRCGLDYHLIMGTEPTVPSRWWTWQPDADTRVDVVALRRCLEDLGLRSRAERPTWRGRVSTARG
jgi:hypothetical protein